VSFVDHHSLEAHPGDHLEPQPVSLPLGGEEQQVDLPRNRLLEDRALLGFLSVAVHEGSANALLEGALDLLGHESFERLEDKDDARLLGWAASAW
jgi:hypothetical protein